MNKDRIAEKLFRGIDGSRIVVRAPQVTDGVAVYEAVLESISELRQFPASLPWAMMPPSPESSTEFCERSIRAIREVTELPLLIFDSRTECLIGSIGLHRIDWKDRRFELGFWCRTSCCRNGYIREAAKLVVNFAFDMCDASLIFALPDTENTRSVAALTQLGFDIEKVIRKERQDPTGAWRDSVLFTRSRPFLE